MEATDVKHVILSLDEVFQTEFAWRLNVIAPSVVVTLYRHAINVFDSGIDHLAHNIQMYGNSIPNLAYHGDDTRAVILDVWPRLVGAFYQLFGENRLFQSDETGTFIPLWPEHVALTYLVMKLNQTYSPEEMQHVQRR